MFEKNSRFTSAKTNMSPENQSLVQMHFPLKKSLFRGYVKLQLDRFKLKFINSMVVSGSPKRW